MEVKKQQLQSDMERQTGSKLGKENIKAIYCHPAQLILCRVNSESGSVVSDYLRPHGLSMEFSRPEYWSG